MSIIRVLSVLSTTCVVFSAQRDVEALVLSRKASSNFGRLLAKNADIRFLGGSAMGAAHIAYNVRNNNNQAHTQGILDAQKCDSIDVAPQTILDAHKFVPAKKSLADEIVVPLETASTVHRTDFSDAVRAYEQQMQVYVENEKEIEKVAAKIEKHESELRRNKFLSENIEVPEGSKLDKGTYIMHMRGRYERRNKVLQYGLEELQNEIDGLKKAQNELRGETFKKLIPVI